MMVPRAFSYSSMKEQYIQVDEKIVRRPAHASPDTTKAKSTPVSPEPAPTKPVGIPRRSSEFLQTLMRTTDDGIQHGSTPTPISACGHDAASLAPSVAALLAMTTIPRPKPHQIRRRRKPPTPRSVSIDELIQDWRSDEPSPSPSLSGQSPLSILLEPPEDQEDGDDDSLENKHQDSDSLQCHSASSDSIPSLTADETSLLSTSNPSTPEVARSATSFERKPKLFSSPEPTSCELDHPLLHLSISHDEDDILLATLPSIPTLPNSSRSSPTLTSTFKSNLTASLLALKSAARSFSNFTAPSLPSDDLLTRSIIFPRFTPEMRPKPVPGVPEPALRRYLNPSHPALQSDPRQHQHGHASSSPSTIPHETAASMLYHATSPSPGPTIQMQTYQRALSSRARASSSSSSSSSPTRPPSSSAQPSLATEATRILAPSSCSADAVLDSAEAAAMMAPTVLRPREPRENADFLRVVVLEMNMRRAGKLDARKPGRARIWLPPRRAVVLVEDVAMDGDGVDGEEAVPARWVGVVA